MKGTFAVLLILGVGLATANAISIPGRQLLADFPVDWKLGTVYPPLNITVGDTVKWTWSGGPTHDVSKTPSRECGNYTLVSDPPSSDGSFSKTFDTKGTFWYACSVGSHCEDGLRITVYVK